jgi:hypothetical protein
MGHRISPEKQKIVADNWPAILQAIRDGARIDHTAASYGLVRADLWAYRNGKPDLVAAWYDAIKDSADAFVDQMVNVMAEAEGNAKSARVKAGILQWIAEKRDPDRYGQRTRADINVKTVDLTAIIKDANARLAAAKDPRLIEGERINTADVDNARAHTQSAITHATLEAAGLL